MAWEPLGWSAAAFSEIDPFARAVLQHRFPNVPLHGDFTTIGADDYGPIDLLVGGTPCQDFSFAGLRAGVDGERGNLTLEFLRLLDRKRPKWMVWENVPGVLSSTSHDDPEEVPPPDNVDPRILEFSVDTEYERDERHAFACFLAGLSELGYGWAYRVLDAQYFGVPQRRRRVFVVGYLGDARRASAVLLERNSVCGHPPPRRRSRSNASTIAGDGAGDGVTQSLTVGLSSGAADLAHAQAGWLINATLHSNITGEECDVAPTLDARAGDGPRRKQEAAIIAFQSTQTYIAFSSKDYGGDASEDLAPTLRSMNAVDGNQNGGGQIAIAFHTNMGKDARTDGVSENVAGTLSGGAGGNGQAVAYSPEVALTVTSSLGHHGHSSPRGDGTDNIVTGFQSSQIGVREVETHATLDANNGSRRQNGVRIGGKGSSDVRRLTPRKRECEALQGLPPNWTLIPNWVFKVNDRTKKFAKDAAENGQTVDEAHQEIADWYGVTREFLREVGVTPDGPRYHALGNSFAVPVIRWIGKRIEMVEKIVNP